MGFTVDSRERFTVLRGSTTIWTATSISIFPIPTVSPGDSYNGFDRIYRNNGDGTFTDVSSALGLEQNNYSRRGGVVADIDLDGDLDILYVNAAVMDASSNKIPDSPYRTVYINRLNENGTFTLEHRGIDYVEWSEGITSLDYDSDGDVDILIANQDGSVGRLVLWENDGTGNFSDVTVSVGLDLDDGLNGSVTTGDVDNDGDMDIYNTDGLYRNDIAEFGTFTFLGSIGGGHEDMHFSDLDNDGDVDLVSGGVYWNDGNGNFTQDDLGVVSSSARGGMGIDYDNDGDLDLIFNEDDRTKPYLNFFRNDLSNGNHWLKVGLVDPNGAIGSPGAKVSVYEVGTNNLLGYREVATATGFVSGASPIQHFGLGSHLAADVVVTFTNGATLTQNNVGGGSSDHRRWAGAGRGSSGGTDGARRCGRLGFSDRSRLGGTTASPDLAGYDVYRSTAPGFVPDAGNRVATNVPASQYSDGGLASSTTYYYRVTAVDFAGNESSASGEASATTDEEPAPDTTPPAAPTGLTAAAVSTSQINLNWADNGESDLADYDVYRATQAGFTPDVSNRIASNMAASQYNDTGLTASTTYYYRVTAVDTSNNESAASSEASATTASVPATQTLSPVADTYVKKDSTSSHGSEDRLLAKHTNGSSRRETYLKFDISVDHGAGDRRDVYESARGPRARGRTRQRCSSRSSRTRVGMSRSTGTRVLRIPPWERRWRRCRCRSSRSSGGKSTSQTTSKRSGRQASLR